MGALGGIRGKNSPLTAFYKRLVGRGKAKKLAIMYERNKAGPTFPEAIPGRMNRPELIIAPEAMQKTSRSPSPFFSFSSMIVLVRLLFWQDSSLPLCCRESPHYPIDDILC